MKKLFSRLAILSLTLIAATLTLTPQPASAKVISSNEAIVIGAEETVDDDVFAGGQTITVEGTINGDLYAAGSTININGTVNGDVLVGGGTVSVSGIIKEDLRAAGGFVTISKAEIGDGISAFGGRVSLDSETSVGGSVMVGSGTFDTSGKIGRGLFVGAGTANINGPVGKNTYVGSENITVGPKAVLEGNLKYAAENEAAIHTDSVIKGEAKQYMPESVSKLGGKDWRSRARRFTNSFRVVSYLSAVLIGALLLHFFPKTTKKVVEDMVEKPWASLGWGLVVLFMTFPALLLLAVTVIGLPLAFILGMVFVAEIYLAKIFIGIVLGQMLSDLLSLKETNQYLRFSLGLAVYYLLTLIPLVRFFTTTAAIIFGLGSLFIYKKEALIS